MLGRPPEVIIPRYLVLGYKVGPHEVTYQGDSVREVGAPEVTYRRDFLGHVGEAS